jgi:hypothetical protein
LLCVSLRVQAGFALQEFTINMTLCPKRCQSIKFMRHAVGYLFETWTIFRVRIGIMIDISFPCRITFTMRRRFYGGGRGLYEGCQAHPFVDVRQISW